MFQEYNEVLKIIAAFVAPLLVFAAALATIRREAAKAAAPPNPSHPNVGPAGLVAIGGAFADRLAMKDYVESQNDMSDAIKALARANSDVGHKQVDRLRDISEQAARIAEANEGILAHLTRQAKKRERQEDGFNPG